MSRDSEATSVRTSLVHMGSNDDQTSYSRIKYLFDGSSISKKESASNPSPEEAGPSGRCPRKIVLINDWSVHDFPVNMSDEVFSRLRPRFQIPDNMPIRKGHKGEKCYIGGSSDVGFIRLLS